MIHEFDRVVLTARVPAGAWRCGDVGTVVHVYADGKAFEIEFMTLDGQTVAVRDCRGIRGSPRHGSRDYTFA